jgi:hypothetical protein
MKKNIGTRDRLIRLGLAGVFLGLSWYFKSWILLLVALFIFYEAFIGWCIVYQLLGKTSCPLNR